MIPFSVGYPSTTLVWMNTSSDHLCLHRSWDLSHDLAASLESNKPYAPIVNFSSLYFFNLAKDTSSFAFGYSTTFLVHFLLNSKTFSGWGILCKLREVIHHVIHTTYEKFSFLFFLSVFIDFLNNFSYKIFVEK